jgi:hypothetical protein
MLAFVRMNVRFGVIDGMETFWILELSKRIQGECSQSISIWFSEPMFWKLLQNGCNRVYISWT